MGVAERGGGKRVALRETQRESERLGWVVQRDRERGKEREGRGGGSTEREREFTDTRL